MTEPSRTVPLQDPEEVARHWVRLGLLDPKWLKFVQRVKSSYD